MTTTVVEPLEAKDSLRSRAFRAGSWILVGFGASQVLRFASTLVMTRLLVPEMYGVMSIVSVVTVVLALLTDMGISQNIVRSHRGNDPAFLNTAWTVQIIRGFVIYAATLFVAGGIEVARRHGWVPSDSVYSAPMLPLAIAVSSISIVLAGFSSTSVAQAQRNLAQGRLTVIELSSQIISVAVMMTVGFATRSIWALVAGGLAAQLFSTIFSHKALPGHKVYFQWEREAVKELIHFGKWVFFSSAIGVFSFNGDRIALGLLENAATLGNYSIAVALTATVSGIFSKMILTLSMPILSHVVRTDSSSIKKAYYKLRIPADLSLLFIAGFVYETGETIVSLLYDHRYQGAGWMLSVLAVGMISGRYDVASQLYIAMGTTKRLAVISATRFVSLYIAIPVLYYFFGLLGAVWGIALSNIPSNLLTYYFNSKDSVNNWWFEVCVLPLIPIGIGAGALANHAAGMFRAH